jgi:hypothetical protein
MVSWRRYTSLAGVAPCLTLRIIRISSAGSYDNTLLVGCQRVFMALTLGLK